MKKIPLTRKWLRENYDYDPSDGSFINLNTGKKIGWVDRGYLRASVRGGTYFVHRLIWLYMFGYMPEQIDHINLDKLDNRLENLRACNASENSQNRTLQRNNTSGCPGVNWSTRAGKWEARIGVNNERIRLGQHDSLMAAAFAYVQAKARYHTFQPTVPLG